MPNLWSCKGLIVLQQHLLKLSGRELVLKGELAANVHREQQTQGVRLTLMLMLLLLLLLLLLLHLLHLRLPLLPL